MNTRTRDQNGKYSSTSKDASKARAYWTKGFEQGFAYATGRSFGFQSGSSFGRFGQTFAYGLQRGKTAGIVSREYGVDLSSVLV